MKMAARFFGGILIGSFGIVPYGTDVVAGPGRVSEVKLILFSPYALAVTPAVRRFSRIISVKLASGP